MTKPRFLVDVDEVLADLHTPLLEIMAEVTGRPYRRDFFREWDLFSVLSKEEEQKVHDRMGQQGFCASLRPFPEAQAALDYLQAYVDVFVVTSPYHSPFWVSERTDWLKKHFGICKDQTVHTSAKYLVKGNYFLDDKPEHVMAWSKDNPRGKAMLWDLPNTRLLGLNQFRVYTWNQVLEQVRG